MKLYHWTHKDNIASIAEQGLCCRYATGALKAVWMCDTTRIDYARDHIARRHGWEEKDMVLLAVDVHDWPLCGSRWEGIYYSRTDIDYYRVFTLRLMVVRTVDDRDVE